MHYYKTLRKIVNEIPFFRIKLKPVGNNSWSAQYKFWYDASGAGPLKGFINKAPVCLFQQLTTHMYRLSLPVWWYKIFFNIIIIIEKHPDSYIAVTIEVSNLGRNFWTDLSQNRETSPLCSMHHAASCSHAKYWPPGKNGPTLGPLFFLFDTENLYPGHNFWMVI